nr:unknown [Zea mays]
MALKSAVDLGIADAIHSHGGNATLPQIVSRAALHPSKIPCLRRLMRVLTAAGIFSAAHRSPDDGGGELVYGLTPASQLLVGGSSSLAPFMSLVLHQVYVSPFLGLGTWLQHERSDPTLFEMTHGLTAWDLNDHKPAFGELFNQGMVCDSSFVMDIVVKECGDVFRGLSSLVDVAGGLGAAALAISTAFPHVQCSVLDLPHVAANAPANTSVKYIAGDMFESIPPADAVFLKWVLHDWGDADCIKILKNCKKAIPSRDAGGKVIIVDMVVGGQSSNIKHKETQVLFDLFIMTINGAERDEHEWKKIISEAGFSDYKIIPVLGVRSIIEVYP